MTRLNISKSGCWRWIIILKHSQLSTYFCVANEKSGKSHLREDSMIDGKVMTLQFVKMKQLARGSLRP
jgi:hypothetical protein